MYVLVGYLLHVTATILDVDRCGDLLPESSVAMYGHNRQSGGGVTLFICLFGGRWDFLGDWITPHGSESKPTSPENILFNNCYYAYITKLTANIAHILGHDEVRRPVEQ